MSEGVKRPSDSRLLANLEHRGQTLSKQIVCTGILLVGTPLYPNPNISVKEFVQGIGLIFGSVVSIIFVLTLLASGLSSSALGTIAGQVVMKV